MIDFDPASMRHTAIIQNKVRTQDNNGIETFTWVMVKEQVPCSIMPLRGRELVAMTAVDSEVQLKIVIHKMDINSSMRIIANGKNYHIITIMPDNTDNVFLTIITRQGVSNG